MTPDDVQPHVRHWTAVYVDDDDQPTYRGLLDWHEVGASVVVAGSPFGESDAIRCLHPPIPIASISKMDGLDDPPWLVNANKAATVLNAQALLRDREDG